MVNGLPLRPGMGSAVTPAALRADAGWGKLGAGWGGGGAFDEPAGGKEVGIDMKRVSAANGWSTAPAKPSGGTSGGRPAWPPGRCRAGPAGVPKPGNGADVGAARCIIDTGGKKGNVDVVKVGSGGGANDIDAGPRAPAAAADAPRPAAPLASTCGLVGAFAIIEDTPLDFKIDKNFVVLSISNRKLNIE